VETFSQIENSDGDIKKMDFNAEKIAKEIFPEKSGDFIQHVIWEHTGYPNFWNIPEEGKTPEECFRNQLKKLKLEE